MASQAMQSSAPGFCYFFHKFSLKKKKSFKLTLMTIKLYFNENIIASSIIFLVSFLFAILPTSVHIRMC